MSIEATEEFSVSTEQLTAALSELLGDRRLSVVHRTENLHTSSYRSEVVLCRLDRGAEVELLCKHASVDALDSGHASHGTRGGVEYEALVYERVLDREPRTVAYHGLSRTSSGSRMLVIEYLAQGIRVGKRPDEGMPLAAQWIGRLHSTGRQPDLSGDFLTRYDETFYREWVDRALQFAPNSRAAGWLTVCWDSFWAWVTLLLDAEPTVIHGEYYPKNILYADGAVYPVDWETAAVAAGEIDLAMLTEQWDPKTIATCEQIYSLTRWHDEAPADFPQRLCAARLFVGLRWLGDGFEWAREPEWLDGLRSHADQLGLI